MTAMGADSHTRFLPPRAAPDAPHVVIAGVSARAMAESASRAGYAVTAVDAYADLDLATFADARRVAPYSARAAALAAGAAASAHGRDAIVCYVSNFENHGDALRLLARGRRLWGNSPTTVAAVRTPALLARALADAGIPVPRVRGSPPRRGTADARRRWLLKPRASGGGHGIGAWRPGLRVPRQCILQERITGPAGSLVFVADGARCVPIAVTRQLVGDRRFGATAFRYCGNILARNDDPVWGRGAALWTGAAAAAAAATRAFGLVGVNGLDFVVRRGQPLPVEINPRFTAAMELAERRDGLSIFAAHAAGCTDQLSTLATPSLDTGALGKALLMARRAFTAGDTHSWLDNSDLRDVPNPGAHIPAGGPICTLFAAGATAAECYDRLTQRAAQLYEQLTASY
jgi:predicted ATP-grasp superfamily ATP-dependent carboligase